MLREQTQKISFLWSDHSPRHGLLGVTCLRLFFNAHGNGLKWLKLLKVKLVFDHSIGAQKTYDLFCGIELKINIDKDLIIKDLALFGQTSLKHPRPPWVSIYTIYGLVM